ncbi:hypothetical protein [Bacillus alkalicola]|uniref:Uncharacterized protein n=1 Tax=Evansella alkalicola TaxID=745819 RepID=A0ABS6JQB8_9BACI|nr:hypothetical protein [Bacillus alkalicola]MBU9720759.1 hypothetical protein [Bacillus alkalicola]
MLVPEAIVWQGLRVLFRGNSERIGESTKFRGSYIYFVLETGKKRPVFVVLASGRII